MAHTYKDALQQSCDYFCGDELAASVFVGKYALKNQQGEILEPTPEVMHRRLAREFARIESKYTNAMSEQVIFDLFDKFKYVCPQGSPMSGIGNPYQYQSLSNCFVIEVGDSYGWIMKADEELAQIFKRRGGCGVDISNLRPNGASTTNSAGSSTGLASFMERFSNTSREVGQAGRRAAEMVTVSCHHPDVLDFINIKRDKKKVTGANISVRFTDDFMKAVESNGSIELRFPVDSPTPSIRKTVKARDIWDQVITAAWESAEPGVLFWDTVTKNCPADRYPTFKSISTNPCSEINLSKNDACRLLLINVYSFIDNPFTPQASINENLFKTVSRQAQRLMDDLVDLEIEAIERIINKVNDDPEPDSVKSTELALWNNIKSACITGRRTGLGLTGVGDMIAAMGLQYGSQESIDFVEKLYKTLCLESYRSSVELATERGSFPAFEHSLEQNDPFVTRVINNLDETTRNLYKHHGRRNIACLTTAPCGSVSILTQTTSGIEPVYKLSYTRRRKLNPGDQINKVDFVDSLGDKWQEYTVHHKGFQDWMKVTGLTSVEQSPYWKGTAMDIDWLAGVKLQASAQRWIDHAISRTQNLPASVSKQTISDIYLEAWRQGCKGYTVYRDGCRSGVLVDSSESVANNNTLTTTSFKPHHAPKRPKELECDIYHSMVQGERWSIFVGLMDGKPYEVMAGLAKYVRIPKRVKHGKLVKHNGETYNPAKYDLHYDFLSSEDETVIGDVGNVFENPVHSGYTRMISLSLRHGTPVQFVAEQLVKAGEKESDLFSISKVLSRVLKNYIEDGLKPSEKGCVECKSKDLAYKEGCVSCLSCGWSKCN